MVVGISGASGTVYGEPLTDEAPAASLAATGRA
jgi:3-polyprenyl-4-hydroxybenzoate decarboxylase